MHLEVRAGKDLGIIWPSLYFMLEKKSLIFILLFYVYECFAYMYVCAQCVCLPMEVIRGHWH